MIDEIKSLGEGTIVAPPPITVFLHDLAGQDVYFDTHYYFLKLQCTYVVVYDLRIPFDSPAQPRFKPKLKAEHNLNNPFLQTNLDYFLSWFNVLNRQVLDFFIIVIARLHGMLFNPNETHIDK